MTASDTAVIRRELDDLRQALSELVELQRTALEAQHSPADFEPVISRLNGLQDRLQSLERQPEAADERQRLGEVDIERINIVEPDGSLRMTISSAARAPDATVDGYTFERQGGNQAGIIFYNEEGDECGGLVFAGKRRDGGYDAFGGLLFDQFKQDQAIGVTYRDAGGRRAAGLQIWDRPEVGFRELAERYENTWQLPDGPERAEALQAMETEGLLGTDRVFIGKNDQREALIQLHDLNGNVRLRIIVDATGSPKLEFLDDEGTVMQCLPEG